LEKSNPELTGVLKSPIISSHKKLSILKAIFSDNSSEITIDFFDLIAEKDRGDMLLDIIREFQEHYNAHQGIQVAEVTTTFKIGDSLREEFIKMTKEISGLQKVEIIEKINPDIIGGFILKVNDWQLDESLNSKLNSLRLEFSKNLYEKQF
jgi:F-type H+-transporting ATPase subunit delta